MSLSLETGFGRETTWGWSRRAVSSRPWDTMMSDEAELRRAEIRERRAEIRVRCRTLPRRIQDRGCNPPRGRMASPVEGQSRQALTPKVSCPRLPPRLRGQPAGLFARDSWGLAIARPRESVVDPG